MQTIVKLLADADVDHSQIIGGDAVKLLGGIYPPTSPLSFGTPDNKTPFTHRWAQVR